MNDAKEGRSKLQGQSRLQSEFKASLGGLEESCCKIKSKKLSGRVVD